MGYLQPTEYESFGLAPDMTDDWITVASALMESYCRRASLAVSQYTERIRFTTEAQCLRLSYLPLVAQAPNALPIIKVRARYGHSRRGDSLQQVGEIWNAFSIPGAWIDINPMQLDIAVDGTITLPSSLFGPPFNEVEVCYTAGLETIPDAVKSACALIVKNAQSTSGMNVKSSRIDMLQVQYFSDQLVDTNVKTLLRPWVANRLG